MKDLNTIIREAIDSTLEENGINGNSSKESLNRDHSGDRETLAESYVTQAGTFDLNTELLSTKTKKAHQALLEGYVKNLNEISAKLDETYNHNAAFLHGMYFENISDLNSNVTMDSLSYMRLARDFGTFDAWQQDFVACALSARTGWAITGYNMQLNRYVNTIIDLHSNNTMIGMYPVIVIDCWEHSYYNCLLYTSPSPRDVEESRMPSSA